MDIFIPYSAGPEESYSRQLDKQVQREEMPYGYSIAPPAADSEDYDMKKSESKKEYTPRKYHQ